MITELKDNEIFVFGSNMAGRHGKGAAKQALQWGAKYGIGFGQVGRTFAIPTKNSNLNTLPLQTIEGYLTLFIEHARRNSEYRYLLTQIGCGLAGYNWNKDIKPLLSELPENVVLS